jgi:heptaprenyl diphosphate synthase
MFSTAPPADSESLALPVLDEALERRLRAQLRLVEERLEREVRSEAPFVTEAARHLLHAGGKRFRPALTLLCAEAGDSSRPGVVTSACVVELTHLASLYHDDVMDEATTRRGVPSAHSVWGNSVAILTGDLLFARAGSLISSLGAKAIGLQAAIFERLCLGQLHETMGPQPGDDPIEHYIQVLADKTGSLIAAAAQFGVIFSDAPDEYQQPMLDFGEKIGIAFQLIDDVIDLSAEETGKAPGADLRSGVATLPLLYLRRLARADPDAAALVERIERDVDSSAASNDEADLLAAIAELREHDVTRATLVEAHRWAREAVDALEPLPTGSVKKALTRFADTIVERSS